jgi:hypothetical protein
MSGGGFHVHGPHDHEIEHAVQGAHGDGHGNDAGKSMTNQIAMFTAIIATVGAIFAYMGGATQANAGLYKNNAAIKKTEASNQWNYFQSKSTKQSLAEVSRDLTAAETEKAKYQAKIDRYEKEKAEAMKIATWNVNSLTARLQHVLDWLAANPVDVLALQELKLTDDKFPHQALREAGYEAAVFGQKTYNGVALLSRA